MSFIKSVYEDNNKITLTKFNGSSMPTYGGDSYNKEIFKIALLDIETTGLNKQSDQIIELAIKVVAVQKLTIQATSAAELSTYSCAIALESTATNAPVPYAVKYFNINVK